MDSIAHHLFHLGIPAGEKVIRTVLVYLTLVVLLRVLGKRQLAQLNALDLVVLLLLSNVVQNAIIGPDNSWLGGALGAATLLAVNSLIVRFTYRSDRLMHLVQGRPTTLVQRGVVQDQALRKERITRAELEAVLRREGIDGVAEVETVSLEPEGAITPVRKPEPTVRDVIDRLDAIERTLQAR